MNAEPSGVGPLALHSKLIWQCNLREGGPTGRVRHAIRRFANGLYTLDGVAILPHHIKAKIGGDRETLELWAEVIENPAD